MEKYKDLIVIIISIGGGAFAILASIFNWNFFFEHSKTKTFGKLFERNGTRIFYSIVGLILFFIAFKLITK